MFWYQWLAIAALAICLISCMYHFYRILKLGNPPEYARKAGNVGKAVRYSFTGAMSPLQKESAYLHLPTYIAGIIYHIGTFLSIIIFFIYLFDLNIVEWAYRIAVGILVASSLCGIGILIKRIMKHELRSLSNPDDYISNILVTAFQLVTAVDMIYPMWPVYYIISALLLLYLPLGKLKHAVYFFAARYHLGYFYGWRGVWPPNHSRK